MKIIKPSNKDFKKLCLRRFHTKKIVELQVSRILNDIRKYSDKALIYYTKKFDGVKLRPQDLRVRESDISAAFQNIDTHFIKNLKEIIQRLFSYYRSQCKKRVFRIRSSEGSVIEERKVPLESVGIYVPAGTSPLVSTVYMASIPAIVAGVKNIVLASPPNKEGRINPYILVVSSLLKIKNIYKVGGAQAIGGLAFGTEIIPRVDKIVGPGNQYVTEAKRQVFGYVDIDMLAGTSELAIVASSFSNFDYVVQDLKSQEEHFKSLIFLITNSKKLIRYVKNEVSSGYIVQVKNMKEALDAVNNIAPEHLQIMIKSPKRFLKGIKNAGAVFLGNFSPTAIGDYIAGPSHILPTMGSARFFSGLGVESFLKTIHIINFSRKELEKTRNLVGMISNLEGLKKHLESVEIRFKR